VVAPETLSRPLSRLTGSPGGNELDAGVFESALDRLDGALLEGAPFSKRVTVDVGALDCRPEAGQRSLRAVPQVHLSEEGVRRC
jgi:hypothetical protein